MGLLVLQFAVLLLQALVGGLQAAVLPDQGLVLGRLPLVERRQLLVIPQQQLVGGPHILLLLQRRLAFVLHAALLALQLCILGHQGGAPRAQGGVLHLKHRGRTNKIENCSSYLRLVFFNHWCTVK